MAEKIFVDGVRFNRKENAPTFVIGSLSIKVPDLIPFLNKHQNNAGYVNVDIKISSKNKYYLELNTWKPTQMYAQNKEKNQQELNNMDTIEYPDEQINPEDIPF